MHRIKFRNNGSSSNKSSFNEDDKKLLREVNSTVKSLVNKIQILKEIGVNKSTIGVNKEKLN